MKTSRVGIYGGSFNPVHFGHLRAAEEVRESVRLDEIWLLPANSPPHKAAEDLAPAANRVCMLELAIGDASGLRVCSIELERGGPSYTIDTLQLLKQRHPEHDFTLVLGLDGFAELHTWHRFAEIPAACDLIVTSRPPHDVQPGPDALTQATSAIAVRRAFWYDSAIGSFRHHSGHRLDFVPVTAIGVSASALRAAIGAGRSIRFLTPDTVSTYIAANGLYQGRHSA